MQLSVQYICESVCLCQNVCICLCVHVCRIPGTDGSGALHAHVEALLMPAYCFAPCVCVLLRVCYSLRRPGLALRPLMVSEREAPADREPGLTWEHPRQHKTKEKALCVLWLFFSASCCSADLLLPLLSNQRCFNPPEGAVYYCKFCGCIRRVHSLIINHWEQLWYVEFISEDISPTHLL